MSDTSDRKGFEVSIGTTFVEHFTQFTITRDIDTFVDPFSITISNPKSRYSTIFPVGGIIRIYLNAVEIFRGVIEKKTTSYSSGIGNTLTLSGREEMVLLTENDVDPTIGPFKGVSDNSIIEQLCSDLGWLFELGDPATITEYDIGGGSKRVAEVLDDVVKSNDYLLFKKGKTLKKARIPIVPDLSNIAETFSHTIQGGKFSKNTNRILSITFNEDITSVRSKVIGFTYENGKQKSSKRVSLTNTKLEDGSYATRLRNLASMEGYNISRLRYLTVPAKDEDELGKMTTSSLKGSDITASIEIKLYGYIDLELLDVVDVQIEQEYILQYMYVSKLEYNLSAQNETTTTVTLKPFPVVYIEE